MEPLVTICIPTYNSSKTINKTLQSIISQTYQNLEIIIVDNNSSDDTVDRVKLIEDSRIETYVYPQHSDVGEDNWNRCFNYMTGKYASVFHSDDVYKPYMVERQIEALENNPNVCAVFTGGEFIDADYNIIKRIPIVEEYKNQKPLNQRDVLISTLNNGNTLFTPSAMFSKEVYTHLAPFRYDMFRYSSDLDMWLRAAKFSHIMVIDAPLLRYRISSSQGSQTIHAKRTSEEAFFVTVDYYLKQYNDIPQDSIDKYEMRRLIDKLVCVKSQLEQFGTRLPKMIKWGLQQKIGVK